jgi:hypothetical protein
MHRPPPIPTGDFPAFQVKDDSWTIPGLFVTRSSHTRSSTLFRSNSRNRLLDSVFPQRTHQSFYFFSTSLNHRRCTSIFLKLPLPILLLTSDCLLFFCFYLSNQVNRSSFVNSLIEACTIFRTQRSPLVASFAKPKSI